MGQSSLSPHTETETLRPFRFIYRWDENRVIRLSSKKSRLKSYCTPILDLNSTTVILSFERSEILRLHETVLFENWIERGHYQAWTGEVVEVSKYKDLHPRWGYRKKQRVVIKFSTSSLHYLRLSQIVLKQRQSLKSKFFKKMKGLISEIFLKNP